MQQYRTDNYSDWLKSYPWEAFITIRATDCHISFFEVQKLVIRDVLRPLALRIRDQVAAILVTVPDDIPVLAREEPAHCHCHILLATKRGALPGTKELKDYLLAQKTSLLTHEQSIDIRPAQDWHPAYITGQKNAGVDGATIGFYNKKLLQKIIKENEK